jgi:hypothetical protein
MTEAAWLTGREPVAMLVAVRGSASDRKLRLFAAACWYRVWAAQVDAKTRRVVELFVRHVDGTISPNEWREGFAAAGGANLGQHFRLLFCTDPVMAAAESAKFAVQDAAWQQSWDATEADVRATFPELIGKPSWRNLIRNKVQAREENEQAALVRDVFGNPFRPVCFSPEWRTDTAMSLARTMYDAREFSAMPILADALQDAGCDSDDVLNHCRGDGPHVRGCWVCDLVLGKQ